MSFIDHYQNTMREEYSGCYANSELNPELLITLLSSIMGGYLSRVHGGVIDFSFLLRPFFNLYVYIYANGSALEPLKKAVLDKQFVFGNINKLSEVEFNGYVHQLVYGLSQADDPQAYVASILTSEFTARPPLKVDMLREVLDNKWESKKSQVGISLSFTAIEQIALKCQLGGSIRFVKIEKHKSDPEVDLAARLAMLDSFSEHVDVKRLCEKEYRLLLSSVLFLPTYFLEQFDHCYLRAQQHADGLKALICGIEFQHKPIQAVLLAILKNRGVPLVGSQHGGFYGQTDATWLEQTERSVFDHYITWGYRYNENDHPLPSVRLSRKRLPAPLSHVKRLISPIKRKSILVVLPHIMPTLAYSIQSPGVMRQQQALYRSLAMLDLLADAGYEVTLRAHPRNPIQDYEAAIPDRLKDSADLCNGKNSRLIEAMRQFEWVFFTNPNATGLSECVANGVEFRIIADSRDYEIRAEAAQVYHSLQLKNVWFTEKVQLKHLHKESGQKARTEAIEEFVCMYGLHSKKYLRVWADYIKTLNKIGL